MTCHFSLCKWGSWEHNVSLKCTSHGKAYRHMLIFEKVNYSSKVICAETECLNSSSDFFTWKDQIATMYFSLFFFSHMSPLLKPCVHVCIPILNRWNMQLLQSLTVPQLFRVLKKVLVFWNHCYFRRWQKKAKQSPCDAQNSTLFGFLGWQTTALSLFLSMCHLAGCAPSVSGNSKNSNLSTTGLPDFLQ